MEYRLKDEIPVQIARRKFLAGIGAEAAATAAAPLPGQALMTATAPLLPSPFAPAISCGTVPPGRPLND
jgi:hypothetical protein